MDETDRRRLAQVFFFGVFAVLLYNAFRIVSPFLPALAVSASLALILHPLHARLLARLGRPSAAAALTAALVFLSVLLPLSLAGWTLARETARLYPEARERLERLRAWQPPADASSPTRRLWDRTRVLIEGRDKRFKDFFLDNIDEIGGRATQALGAGVKNSALFAFYLVVVIISLFFFLRDGPALLRGWAELLPMPAERKAALFSRVRDVMNAVVLGILAAALVQGVLAWAGLAALGIPFPVLLGSLCVFVSPIPFVGTALVWVPLAAGLALSGSLGKAAALAAWFLVVVGLSDNLVRPLLIGSRVGFPLPLVFIGVIGGLVAFGPFGIFMGPVVVALVLAFAKIFKEEYRPHD